MPTYYIVEDEYPMPNRDTGPTVFRFSIVRLDDERRIFRAATYEEAEKLLRRLKTFAEVKAA